MVALLFFFLVIFLSREWNQINDTKFNFHFLYKFKIVIIIFDSPSTYKYIKFLFTSFSYAPKSHMKFKLLRDFS